MSTLRDAFGPLACLPLGTVGVAPTVATQPASASVVDGGAAIFTAVFHGSPQPALQWFRGGTVVEGATSGTYDFTATMADSGVAVLCRASNVAGRADSTAATLTVTSALAEPQVTVQPTNVTVGPGGAANFTSTATGNPAPTGQWQRSNDAGLTFSNLVGETADTLSLAALLPADSGAQFRRAYSNGVGGTVYSSVATLTVSAVGAPTLPPALLPTMPRLVRAGRLVPRWLDQLDLEEIADIYFDFRPAIVGNDALSSVVVACEARVGTDPAAAAMRVGPPVFDATRCVQRLKPGVPGVIYLVRALATLESGLQVPAAGFIRVRRLG